MDYWTILLSAVAGILGFLLLHARFNYFKRNDVIHVPSLPIFGAMMPLIFRRISVGDFCQKLYDFKPEAKYIGLYATWQRVIMLRDPELVKDILVKNFEHFPNRVGFAYINDPLFSKNLFSLQGQKWKDVRTMLSPAFTSSKMKTMFTLMLDCAVDFAVSLSEIAANRMDMKDAFTKYTNDVIATCAFGIKVDSMSDPTNEFYVYGRDASNFQGLRGLKFFLFMAFPRLTRLLGLKFLSDETGNFFRNLVQTTIRMRETNNVTRPDMIQLMMDIRGKREAERQLTDEEMTAQAFVFFIAGFETTSTAMSFIAQVIAAHPDVQAEVRREIDKTLADSNGRVTYEAINRLEYLEAVINEVLRFYSPIPIVERICEKDYQLPPALPGEKPFVLKKGLVVWVPVYSLQRDAKHYEDPEQFRPERFLGNTAYHNSPCFLPFGLGPRMCIANRFALLEIKVLLFHLLARCEFEPCADFVWPIKLSKSSSIMMAPEGGCLLNVKRRDDMHPAIRSTTLDNTVASR